MAAMTPSTAPRARRGDLAFTAPSLPYQPATHYNANAAKDQP